MNLVKKWMQLGQRQLGAVPIVLVLWKTPWPQELKTHSTPLIPVSQAESSGMHWDIAPQAWHHWRVPCSTLPQAKSSWQREYSCFRPSNNLCIEKLCFFCQACKSSSMDPRKTISETCNLKFLCFPKRDSDYTWLLRTHDTCSCHKRSGTRPLTGLCMSARSYVQQRQDLCKNSPRRISARSFKKISRKLSGKDL